MSWLRLDDGFAEHPKVEQITDKAFRLHVAALCYSARKLTDGFLSMKAVKVLAAIVDAPRVDRYTTELERAGLWLVVEDGYQINDYLDYNPDAEAVKHARAKNAERQLRHRSRNAESNAQSNGVTDSVTNGVSNTPPIPSPSERTDLSAVVPTPRAKEVPPHDEDPISVDDAVEDEPMAGNAPTTCLPAPKLHPDRQADLPAPRPLGTERTDLSVSPRAYARAKLLQDLAEVLYDRDAKTLGVLKREAQHVDDRFLEQLATTCHLNRKGSGYAVNALRAERGRQLVANVDLTSIRPYGAT